MARVTQIKQRKAAVSASAAQAGPAAPTDEESSGSDDGALDDLAATLGLPPSSIPITLKPGETLSDKIPAAKLAAATGPLRTLEDASDAYRTLLLVIPFTFLFLGMDIMVRQQYGQHPLLSELLSRLANALPLLSILIYFSNKHVNLRSTQALLTLASLGLGCRLIWVVNISNWLVVMQQAPPLATLWVYAIVQLDLVPAVLSLAGVGLWTWAKGLSLKF